MPVLANRRHELFARARARGSLLDDAFEAAGYAPHRGHASRLARRPAVAARIAELREEMGQWDAAGGQAVIAALLRMAQNYNDYDRPDRMREARLTIMDARKVQREVNEERRLERERKVASKSGHAKSAHSKSTPRPPAKTTQNLPGAALTPHLASRGPAITLSAPTTVWRAGFRLENVK